MAISVCRGPEDRARTANSQAVQKGLLPRWGREAGKEVLEVCKEGWTTVLGSQGRMNPGTFRAPRSLKMPSPWSGHYRDLQAVRLSLSRSDFRAA